MSKKIEVRFKELQEEQLQCDGCPNTISNEEPYFDIYISKLGQTISLCEDCGIELQNDLGEEHCNDIGGM